MTETTTTAAEPPAADTDTPTTPETPASEATPARRWKTLTVALLAAGALVVGLGGGFAGGWAVASAQQPSFGGGEFPGGQRPDGEMPQFDGEMPQMPGGDMPQGDDSSSDTDSGDDTAS